MLVQGVAYYLLSALLLAAHSTPLAAGLCGFLLLGFERDGDERSRLSAFFLKLGLLGEAPEVSAMPPERFAFLADAISDLLDDAGARARIGVEARAFALAHFTWDVVAAKTVGIYERCVRRPAL